MTDDRRDSLSRGLDSIVARIERAKVAAGRTDPNDQVRLVVVTKTFPASDVELLADVGVRDVGENRDQEARAKRAVLQATPVRWHMIGRLQRNKASSVARWADVVESLDRRELVAPLAAAAERYERAPLEVLIQVSLDPDPDPGRGGAAPADVPFLAEAVAGEPALRLCGVMAVAPHPDTGADPRSAFARLREIAERVQASWPDAKQMSAGMSQDLEAGIAAGATQVRVGGAILGERTYVQ